MIELTPGEKRPENPTLVMLDITGTQLGNDLFSIHTHAEIAFEEDKDQIVYREKDIVELLKKFGFPEPLWDKRN